MKFLIQPLSRWYCSILRNSKYRWLVIACSLLYLVSPIDFVTDVIPVVGWLDDGMVATVLVTEVSQLLLEQRKARQEKGVSSGAVSAS